MIHAFWMSFWIGLICTAAGFVVTLPFLLIKSLRERLFGSAHAIEAIGAIALVIAIVFIGLYNNFWASGG
jgi:hypothetical protein